MSSFLVRTATRPGHTTRLTRPGHLTRLTPIGLTNPSTVPTSPNPGAHTGPRKRCVHLRWSNNYIALTAIIIASVIGLISVLQPDANSLRRRMTMAHYFNNNPNNGMICNKTLEAGYSKSTGIGCWTCPRCFYCKTGMQGDYGVWDDKKTAPPKHPLNFCSSSESDTSTGTDSTLPFEEDAEHTPAPYCPPGYNDGEDAGHSKSTSTEPYNVIPPRYYEYDGEDAPLLGSDHSRAPTKPDDYSPPGKCSRCGGDGKTGWWIFQLFGKCARCKGTPINVKPTIGSEPFGHCNKCKGRKYACALCVLASGTGKCTRCHSRKIRFGSCARCNGSGNRLEPGACERDNCAGEKDPCETCCQREGLGFSLCSRCHGSGRKSGISARSGEKGLCGRCNGRATDPCEFAYNGCDCKGKTGKDKDKIHTL